MDNDRVEMVALQTGASKEAARRALAASNGDVVNAIVALSSGGGNAPEEAPKKVAEDPATPAPGANSTAASATKKPTAAAVDDDDDDDDVDSISDADLVAALRAKKARREALKEKAKAEGEKIRDKADAMRDLLRQREEEAKRLAAEEKKRDAERERRRQEAKLKREAEERALEAEEEAKRREREEERRRSRMSRHSKYGAAAGAAAQAAIADLVDKKAPPTVAASAAAEPAAAPATAAAAAPAAAAGDAPSAAAPSANGHACHQCGNVFDKDHFSKAQWKKGAQGRCLVCVQGGGGGNASAAASPAAKSAAASDAARSAPPAAATEAPVAATTATATTATATTAASDAASAAAASAADVDDIEDEALLEMYRAKKERKKKLAEENLKDMERVRAQLEETKRKMAEEQARFEQQEKAEREERARQREEMRRKREEEMRREEEEAERARQEARERRAAEKAEREAARRQRDDAERAERERRAKAARAELEARQKAAKEAMADERKRVDEQRKQREELERVEALERAKIAEERAQALAAAQSPRSAAAAAQAEAHATGESDEALFEMLDKAAAAIKQGSDASARVKALQAMKSTHTGDDNTHEDDDELFSKVDAAAQALLKSRQSGSLKAALATVGASGDLESMDEADIKSLLQKNAAGLRDRVGLSREAMAALGEAMLHTGTDDIDITTEQAELRMNSGAGEGILSSSGSGIRGGSGKTPLRIGVIGAGKNTCDKHIPKLQLLDNVRVRAVCNRTLKSGENVAAQYRIPNVVVDPYEILNDPEIDAIVIGTWPYKHREYTLAALERNKHVLCEARMAMDAEEAESMHRCALAHPKLVAQVVPSPFTLKYDAVIERVIDERLGRLVLVETFWSTPRFAPKPTDPLTWREDRALSGNNIMQLGIVYECLLRWLGEADTVLASSAITVPQRFSEQRKESVDVLLPDVLTVSGRMQRERAPYRMCFSEVSGLVSRKEIWLYGTTGTICFDGELGEVRFGGRLDKTMYPMLPKRAELGEWRVEEEFVGAIRGEEKVQRTTFADGVRYMRFTDAVNRSLEEERLVFVNAERESAHASERAADEHTSDAEKVRALLASQKAQQAELSNAKKNASTLQRALDDSAAQGRESEARVKELEAEVKVLKEQNEDLDRLLRVTKNASKQQQATEGASKDELQARDEEVKRWRRAAETALSSAESQAETIRSLQSQLLALTRGD